MNRYITAFIFCTLLFSCTVNSQSARPLTDQVYRDSLRVFRENYMNTHEIVKTPEERALFRFYPIDPSYYISCRFEKTNNGNWFSMNTSGKSKQVYRVYGTLSFSVHDTLVKLSVYQSQALIGTMDYKDYLFIPFTDQTSAIETYGAGRYLECFITDIHNGNLWLDFNKAYNPYCAYTTGYDCPIPPAENSLPVSIRAGEKIFAREKAAAH